MFGGGSARAWIRFGGGSDEVWGRFGGLGGGEASTLLLLVVSSVGSPSPLPSERKTNLVTHNRLVCN